MKSKISKETYDDFVKEYSFVVRAVFRAEDELKEELQELLKSGDNKDKIADEYCLKISQRIVDSSYEIKD